MMVRNMRAFSDGDRKSTALQCNALIAADVDQHHLLKDRAAEACDDRPDLKSCLEVLKGNNTLVVWKLKRHGQSLPYLLSIVAGLLDVSVAFRSLTEATDKNIPHEEFLLHIFGTLAQYKNCLDSR